MYVVILDDTELNNLLLEEALLALAGVTCIAFTRPVEALGFIGRNASDIALVFVDFEMPEMNGVEVTRHVRDMPDMKHTPVVMITSSNQRQVKQAALDAGTTDFLSKPFDPHEVRARATNLLALHKARLEEVDRAAWLAREVERAVATIEQREQEIITRLVGAAEHRDLDTGAHVQRVSSYVKIIAAKLNLDRETCRDLALASTMHDIGKLAVSDTILFKDGPLTPEERTSMNAHTEAGFKILEGSPIRTLQLASEIALTHHERWDGTGYPRSLSGEEIPLSGRIAAVADVFDALVSDRPYKRGWPLQDARLFLEEQAGRHFDPRCVKAFLADWPEIVTVAETARATPV